MKWNDLTMSQRSDLMKLYLKHGITSLDSMRAHYNSFADGGKIPFKVWKAKMKAKYPDIEMENDKAGYDYEAYFTNNYEDAVRQLSNLQHFPDTYKLPNHPTFSNESIYSRGPMMGGSWVNDTTFTPSVINRQYHPNIYREDRNYTEREIYNSYDIGGHLYLDGGPDDDKTFVTSQASETGWMPEVDIVSEKPAWQRGLTDYDWARARQYYSDADGNLTNQGIEFLRNISSKRTTGQSNFMRDVNKLSYIPNAAVGAIGAVPAAAALLAATTNPVVDAILTAHGAITASTNIKKGIQDIQEGDTWQGVGELGLVGLDLLGAGKLLKHIGNTLPRFNHTGVRYSEGLQAEIKALQAERVASERQLVEETPLGLSHVVSEENLLKTIQNYNGKTAAISLAAGRLDPVTGLIPTNRMYARNKPMIQFYFEEPPNSTDWLYWAGDAMWPTYRHISRRYPNANTLDEILKAKRDFASQNHFADIPNPLFPRPDGRTEALRYAREHPENYAEIVPNFIFDLSNAKYAITETQNPLILQWLKDKGISTDINAFLQDPTIRFKNGGKLK